VGLNLGIDLCKRSDNARASDSGRTATDGIYDYERTMRFFYARKMLVDFFPSSQLRESIGSEFSSARLYDFFWIHGRSTPDTLSGVKGVAVAPHEKYKDVLLILVEHFW
jgi:hypothetical protein